MIATLIFIENLPSSSCIETVATAGLTSVTPYGSEMGSTETVNVSDFSNMLSSIIRMSNETLVMPAENTTNVWADGLET